MNSNLYVLNYNNYYNRIVKRLDTLDEYMTYSTGITIESCSFNPNDGVTTSHYFKSNIKQFNGDYLLETQVNTQGIEQIKSRWFILEVRRERVGGWTLTLQRDIVADKYDAIIEAPVFIEKATVGLNDSAIFNSENMTFNEIKTKETLLKDKTNIPWIAVYVAAADGEGNIPALEGSVAFKQEADFDLHTQASTSWKYYNSTQYGQLITYKYGIRYYYTPSHSTATVSRITYVNNTDVEDIWDKTDPEWHSGYLGDWTGKIKNTWYSYSSLNALSTTAFSFLTAANEEELLNYNGKTIQFSDGIFRVSVKKDLINVTKNITNSNTDLYNSLNNTTKTNLGTQLDGNAEAFRLVGTQYKYGVTIEQVAPATSYSYDFPTTRNHLNDNPYDLILLPFGDIVFRQSQSGFFEHTNKDVAYLIAQDIARKYSGNKTVLDIQILPYFPELSWIAGTDVLPVIRLYDRVASDYALIKDSNNAVKSLAFFMTKSTFTSRITATCSSESEETDNIGYKTRIECDKYRLCSPNYAGAFDFNNIKAGYTTSIMSFDVDCTYMPYNPYIHVTPVFNGRLYGQDFDDARGLICGGDFSMAMASSQWETYQLNNKNYQATFDRQIQNIEINNSIQKVNDVVSSIVGTAQGAVSGATTGAISGGGTIGAIAGGSIGGTASGIGGVADIINNEVLREEALDYTKDQFGYQLGNIKALPNSLSKTTAYTYNNKYFPFVEYYTCTDEEKKALENKIRYNGMTIMRIGSVSEFIKDDYSYIKGQLIRLEDTGCDSHEVMYIASELNKGIFIK